MKDLTVTSIQDEGITFDDGTKLYSYHEQDCCEHHYLSFEDLSLKDFEGLRFNLEGSFFNRVEGYGIELLPVNGFPIRVAGYGSNNGYYSNEMTLVVESADGSLIYRFNITECQKETGY